jgi:hypothetical protein
VIDRAIELGIDDVERTFCRRVDEKTQHEYRCPHYDQCPYQAQFKQPEDGAGIDVIFMSHNYMAVNMGSERLPTPLFATVDENCFNQLIARQKSRSAEDLKAEVPEFLPLQGTDDLPAELGGVPLTADDLPRLPAPHHEVVEAIFRHPNGEPVSHLQSEGWSEAELAELARDLRPRVAVRPDMADEDIRVELRELKTPPMYAVLRRVVEEWRLQRPPRGLRWRHDGEGWKVGTAHRRRLPRLTDAPLLFLDATAEEPVYKELWPHAAFHRIDARRNAHVIQSYGAHFGKNSAVDRKPQAAARSLAALCRNVDTDGPGLVVTYEGLEDRVAAELADDGRWDTAHFNALRGIDRYRDHRACVVYGRPLPSAEAVEDMARALLYDSPRPIELDHEYHPRAEPLRVDRGKHAGHRSDKPGPGIGLKSLVHPDPRVDALRRMICEAEVTQAVDRLRSVRAQVPPLIVMLNQCATEVPVDELVPWQRLLEPAQLDRAAFDCGGVLPLDRQWLAANLPDRFRSADAAKRAIDRERQGRSIGTVRLEYYSIDEGYQLNAATDTDAEGRAPRLKFIPQFAARAREYTYRPASRNGRRASSCWSVLSPAETERRLTEHVGPIQDFQLAPAPEARAAATPTPAGIDPRALLPIGSDDPAERARRWLARARLTPAERDRLGISVDLIRRTTPELEVFLHVADEEVREVTGQGHAEIRRELARQQARLREICGRHEVESGRRRLCELSSRLDAAWDRRRRCERERLADGFKRLTAAVERSYRADMLARALVSGADDAVWEA